MLKIFTRTTRHAFREYIYGVQTRAAGPHREVTARRRRMASLRTFNRDARAIRYSRGATLFTERTPDVCT